MRRRLSWTPLLALALACASCSFSKKSEQPEQAQAPSAAQASQAPAAPANSAQPHAAIALVPSVEGLPPDAQRPDRILSSGHSGEVQSLAYSPDGRWLATGSADKTVRVWDLSTGRTVRTLTGHTDVVWSAAFSPDGKLLASASQDGTVIVWDTATGASLYTLKPGAIPVQVLFTSDGDNLVVSNQSGDEQSANIEFCSPETGAVFQGTLTLDWGVALHLVATRDGHLLATGGAGEDGDVGTTTKTWDLNKRREINAVPILAEAISPDGRWIVSRAHEQDGHKLLLHDAQSGKLMRVLISGLTAIGHLQFTPDSSRLLAETGTTAGSTMRIWDLATGKEVQTLPGEKDAFERALAFSPDGKYLATATYHENAMRI